MAQFIKVLASSKLLLLPFTAVAVVGVGSCYVTYNTSRWSSAKLLGVDHNNTSTVSTHSQHSLPAASRSMRGPVSHSIILSL